MVGFFQNSSLLIILTFIGCGPPKKVEQRRTVFRDIQSDDATAQQNNTPGGESQQNSSNSGNTNNNDDTKDEIKDDDEFDQTLKLRGEIQDVTAIGEVYGWAVLPDDPSMILEVDVYINGNATDGDFLGSFTADQEGFDNGFEGNHAFRAQIPDEFRDGNTHTLTAFAEIDGNVEPVFSKNFSFRAFLPTQEGRDYYTNTLRPLLQNSCGGCHGNRAPVVTYDAQYDYILSPNPAKTGTADNNNLINKASGGMNHGGGNRCGGNGKDGNPCAQIQTWWEMEFGAAN